MRKIRVYGAITVSIPAGDFYLDVPEQMFEALKILQAQGNWERVDRVIGDLIVDQHAHNILDLCDNIEFEGFDPIDFGEDDETG